MRGELLLNRGETTLAQQRLTPRHDTRWLALILAFQLVMGLVTLIVLPLWQEHEPDYYTVIRFLTDSGRLPTEADYPPGEADVRQATQPPLFFLVAAPVVALFDDGQPVPPGVQPGLICLGGEAANDIRIAYPMTPDYRFPTLGAVTAGYGLRVLNLVFGLAAVCFTWLAGRVLFPRRPAISLVGAALLALEPNTLNLVTTISNDALLLAIAAVNLYCAARMLEGGRARWRWIFPLMGTAALAILTRLSGWSVLGFAVLVILFAIGRTLWQARQSAKPGQARLALGGLALLIVAVLALGIFNYSQYGTVFGRYSWLDEMVLRTIQDFNLPFATIAGVFNQTRNSYLAPVSALTTRQALHTLYLLPVAVALIGVVVGFADAVRRGRGQPTTPGAYLLLLAAVAVAVVLVVFRNTINVSALGGATFYNTAAIFAPLRYYNAALPPLTLLLSAGLMALTEPVRQRLGAGAASPLRQVLSANLLGIGLAGLWLVVGVLGAAALAQNRAAAQVFDLAAYQQDVGALPNSLPAADGGYPALYRHIVSPRAGDGLIDLTLDAGLASPTALNYAVEVAMTSGGQVVNRCQFLPARGYHPTTFWQPETAVRFTTTVPNCAGMLTSPVDVSLRWLGAGMDGLIQDISPPVSLGTITEPLAQAQSCPDTLGIIAGGYRLTRFNSPPIIQRGEIYLPSLNWIITQPTPEALGRTFIFTHDQTAEQFTCSGMDLGVQTWELGEYVYFDRCPVTFPPEAAVGTYTVSVVLTGAAGEWLPAADLSGNPIPGGAVRVGTVELE